MKNPMKTIIFIALVVIAGWFVIRYVRQYMGTQAAQTTTENMQEGAADTMQGEGAAEGM